MVSQLYVSQDIVPLQPPALRCRRRYKKYKLSGFCPDLTRIKKMKIFCRSVIGLGLVFLLVFPLSAVAQLSPGPGALYPYVDAASGLVVCRDEFGGVPTYKLFSRRVAFDVSSTTPNWMSLSRERFPAQFNVKFVSLPNISSIQHLCRDDWRPPTYRETLLVWLLRDELDLGSEEYGWIFTADIGPNQRPFYVYWDYNAVYSAEKLDGFSWGRLRYCLCIRDIDTRSLGLSDITAE